MSRRTLTIVIQNTNMLCGCPIARWDHTLIVNVMLSGCPIWRWDGLVNLIQREMEIS